MKNNRRDAVQLEAELLRLNNLVRERRQQLARLEQCPHKDCECRHVWREVVEQKLASQVGKIRKHVRGKQASAVKKRTTRPRRQTRRSS